MGKNRVVVKKSIPQEGQRNKDVQLKPHIRGITKTRICVKRTRVSTNGKKNSRRKLHDESYDSQEADSKPVEDIKVDHESPEVGECESSNANDGKSNDIKANKSASHKSDNESATTSDLRRTFKLLIGVTASVAAIKLLELMRKFHSVFPKSINIQSNPTVVDIEIRVVITSNVKHFTSKQDLQEESYALIYEDADEWSQWRQLSDPVLHIELRKWADLFLIAPLDANTMAKMANGICDNLLCCIVRAWDLSKPLIYCPAMNVHMYNHPLTNEHLSKLESFGYLRIDPVKKKLACGDYGIGGMASVDSIVDFVVNRISKIQI